MSDEKDKELKRSAAPDRDEMKDTAGGEAASDSGNAPGGPAEQPEPASAEPAAAASAGETDAAASPEFAGGEGAAEGEPDAAPEAAAEEAKPGTAKSKPVTISAAASSDAKPEEAGAARAAAEGGDAPAATAGEAGAVDPEREAKLKAAAEARAARAAAKSAAEGGDAPAAQAGEAGAVDPEREAKLKAAAEARAARAAAKEAAGGAAAAPVEPKAPSPKQPQLDEAAQLIRAIVGEDAIEEAYINELNRDLPTLVVKSERWFETAQALKSHQGLGFPYLRNVSGVDYETHLEVVYHLVSLETKREIAVKVKTDRDQPSVSSVTPVWATANWNEREIYDLLGIDFPGHPDLRRIMMPDDWVGHPLRKDYVPLDPEV